MVPFIAGGIAIVAGIFGIGSSIHGVKKMKDADSTIKSAEAQHRRNLDRLEEKNHTTMEFMDTVGKEELAILDSFNRFSDAMEKIKNRPVFEEYSIEGVTLPAYDPEQLREVSHGAGVLLGSIGSAALGTAGGFAAAGATTAAVTALGTVSAGSAFSAVGGALTANATLAALSGGTVVAGGGGIALGTTAFGAATAGVGLMVGGIFFSFVSSRISKKADEAWYQMKKAEKQINRICAYLDSLMETANRFLSSLQRVNEVYLTHLARMEQIIQKRRCKWEAFNQTEKLIIENTSLLVGLLHETCKVKLVLAAEGGDELNTINYEEIDSAIRKADVLLSERITDYDEQVGIEDDGPQAKDGLLRRFFRWLFSKD